eukprot:TRINITY_DN63875_c0_g1_i1.p1 TRINITY_DN63875_c0_g1~~TRINITY_DN63875_c0_g1_i1.p1  ORF type:complete len:424 (+),score=75.84 TRINITY_DN63875_c0_g1_i1:129-1400(+)
MPQLLVAEALDEVRQAVVALQDAKCQAEDARLEAERLEKVRLEQDRAARVARRAAVRRAKPRTDDACETEDAVDVSGPQDPPLQVQEVATVASHGQVTAHPGAPPNSLDLINAAKARLAAVVQAAKQAGATESDLLAASKPKTIDVEDACAAGAAARRARKLRLQQKVERERFEQERLEQERATRVAARKARAKGEGSDARHTEGALREANTKDGCEAVTPPLAVPEAKQQPIVPGEIDVGLGTNEGSGSTRFGGVSSRCANASVVAHRRSRSRSRCCSTSRSRNRSRSRNCRRRSGSRSGSRRRDQAPAVPTSLGSVEQEDPTLKATTVLAEGGGSDLAGMLWRRPVSDLPDGMGTPARPINVGGASYARAADIPIAALLRKDQSFPNVASDLSTGGGDVCKQFRLGHCYRENCKFRHVGRY